MHLAGPSGLGRHEHIRGRGKAEVQLVEVDHRGHRAKRANQNKRLVTDPTSRAESSLTSPWNVVKVDRVGHHAVEMETRGRTGPLRLPPSCVSASSSCCPSSLRSLTNPDDTLRWLTSRAYPETSSQNITYRCRIGRGKYIPGKD